MIFIRAIGWWSVDLLIRLKFPEIEQLSTEELAAWLNNKNQVNPILLDARTLAEYQVSHLPNAIIVPHDLEDLARKNIDYLTPIVVYCSVGYRSSAIARRLKSLGYKSVFNLSGSIFRWVNQNRPVYRQGKPADRVHPYGKLWQVLLESNKK